MAEAVASDDDNSSFGDREEEEEEEEQPESQVSQEDDDDVDESNRESQDDEDENVKKATGKSVATAGGSGVPGAAGVMGFLKNMDNSVADKIKEHLPKLFLLGYAIENMIKIGTKTYKTGDKMFHKYYDQIEKYHPELIIEMVSGVLLMFFGGFFITTISAVEAFRQGGAARIGKHMGRLREQMNIVLEKNREDNELDEVGDGQPDVLSMERDELLHRKFILVVSHLDPIAVTSALSALYTAFLAVIASLQVKFARTISLGAAIGDKLFKPVDHFVIPLLRDMTDESIHKWYPVVFGYICEGIGALIAFQIQRILSTVHTAVRGGNLLIEASEEYTQKIGLGYLTEGKLDDILIWVFVAIGIYFQLFVFTYLPFIIKLLLFPLFITEWILQVLVSTVDA